MFYVGTIGSNIFISRADSVRGVAHTLNVHKMTTFSARKLGFWHGMCAAVCVRADRRLGGARLCAWAPPLGLSLYLPRAAPHCHAAAQRRAVPLNTHTRTHTQTQPLDRTRAHIQRRVAITLRNLHSTTLIFIISFIKQIAIHCIDEIIAKRYDITVIYVYNNYYSYNSFIRYIWNSQ